MANVTWTSFGLKIAHLALCGSLVLGLLLEPNAHCDSLTLGLPLVSNGTCGYVTMGPLYSITLLMLSLSEMPGLNSIVSGPLL